MAWTETEIRKLMRLASQNKYFYTEIAKTLGKKPQPVRDKARKLGLLSTKRTLAHRFGKWNQKHSHLREPVMKYFLTHTMEETRKRFGLTKSEIKSLFTVGYRMSRFKHLRKETRDHSPWTLNQLKILLRYSGLRSRLFVAKKIGRGNVKSCIKERYMKLGIASRNLQGLTLSQFVQVFGRRPEYFLQTDAGPHGGRSGLLPTRWKIIPWVWLDRQIRKNKLKTSVEMRYLISARAMFQEWIFEGNALRKMENIINDINPSMKKVRGS